MYVLEQWNEERGRHEVALSCEHLASGPPCNYTESEQGPRDYQGSESWFYITVCSLCAFAARASDADACTVLYERMQSAEAEMERLANAGVRDDDLDFAWTVFAANGDTPQTTAERYSFARKAAA